MLYKGLQTCFIFNLLSFIILLYNDIMMKSIAKYINTVYNLSIFIICLLLKFMHMQYACIRARRSMKSN